MYYPGLLFASLFARLVCLGMAATYKNKNLGHFKKSCAKQPLKFKLFNWIQHLLSIEVVSIDPNLELFWQIKHFLKIHQDNH